MSVKKNDTLEENRIKLIFLGDSGVGKTNLINLAIGQPFNENVDCTLGQYFSQKIIRHIGIDYIIDLWDTIGQERLRTINKLFFNNSKIVIFVYDITNLNSFEDLKLWVNEIDSQIGLENIIKGVVGNKIDLFESEEVNYELGDNFAKSIGALFLQISAKKSEQKIFVDFLHDLLKNYVNSDLVVNEKNINKAITLDYAKKKKKREKSKCC